MTDLNPAQQAAQNEARQHGRFGEQPHGDPGPNVIVMAEPDPNRMLTVDDFRSPDDIESARSSIYGAGATDAELEALVAGRAQVDYGHYMNDILAQPETDELNVKLSGLVTTARTEELAIDNLNRMTYDSSPMGAFVTDEELTSWLGDTQTDPVLDNLAGQEENDRYWRIINLAKNRVVTGMVGQTFTAGPRDTPVLITRNIARDGIELHLARTA